ncbi:MAG: hypothetical protein QOI08_2441, partial [Actinomycetota bacterium]|nr:hypothetical protein [Actinomycetota bacterium]
MDVTDCWIEEAYAKYADDLAFLRRAVFNEARMHHRSTMRRRARDLRTASPDR